MYSTYVNYFNLITPLTTFCLGLLLAACWGFLRHQKELLWIAAGYILPATALAAQSGIDNDGLARWTVITAPIYIAGAWCLGHGVALRYKTRSHPMLALAIILSGTALLFYFSRIEPNLWLRVIILNSCILITQILALPSIIRSAKITSLWDRLLLWSFMVFSLLIFVRIGVVLFGEPVADTDLLVGSPYWRFLLTSSLFFSLWFVVILLSTTIATILRNLTYDRDHDSLTGLYNRRAFFEQTQKYLNEPMRGPTCLLTFDIDHFKAVNDTYGHDVGDQVLVAVAKCLSENLSQSHIIARFGGEEFVVVLRDCLPYQAQEFAEEMQHRLRGLMIPGGPQKITASFGVANMDEMESLGDALKRADRALYLAKSNGRDQIQFAKIAS